MTCLFPRVIECFLPLKIFPGCSVAPEESLRYEEAYEVSSDAVVAIPSGMPLTTSSSDLPSIPPPRQYWQLKRLDNSANVMDYWIKNSQEWDISGLESDVKLADTVAARTLRDATVRQ